VGRRIVDNRVGSIVAGALALTAWDLFLDPQMVDEGYWVWAVKGWYREIPWTNYVGWIGAGIVVLAVVDRLLPRASEPTPPLLLALYTWWSVMNTVGFVVFFGDPFVGVVGGVAMGSCAAAAWRPTVARG
jgi:uncharacterized membrane protein